MIIVTGLLSWFMRIVCWMGGMVKNRGNGKTAGFRHGSYDPVQIRR